jgi:O-antigen ligase
MLSGISIPVQHRPTLSEAALVVAGATVVAGFVLLPKAGLIFLIACVVLLFFAALSEVFHGRLDRILLFWAAALPLGPYFGSFPRQQAIVTLDRAVILLAFMGLFLAKPSALIPVPRTLRRSGLAWVAFVAVAAITSISSPMNLNSARILLDSFLLPFLLGWCVVARFDVRNRLSAIHTSVCISSLISAAIAAAEVVTGQDLLPIEGSAMSYAGGIPRPNGPFESNDTLALIGIVSFFFLLFLRKTLGSEMSAARRMLHCVGLAAALGMALMPMFRSVVITLLVVLIIDTYWEQRTTRRAWRIGLMFASVGLIFTATIFAPEVYEDRSSTENASGRIAEYKQTFRVFMDHPVLGVGFQNFHNFVTGEPRYRAVYEGVSSMDWPHSNLAQVLTETGALGFIPYVMANVFLFMAIWQLRQLGASGQLVWKYGIYMFLGYWVSGLTLGSGYSPLNLWYVFAMAVCCKYVLTDPELTQFSEMRRHDESFSVPAQVF